VDRGLLVITVGDAMLRLLPPLVLTDEQADRGLRILGKVIAEVSEKQGLNAETRSRRDTQRSNQPDA
jgi:acetylornithine/succinyldiaminopimelate/putrescine aminotransferase